MSENKGEGWPTAVQISLATLGGYFAVYCFEHGYLYWYDIPSDVIQFSLEVGLRIAGVVLIAIMFTVLPVLWTWQMHHDARSAWSGHPETAWNKLLTFGCAVCWVLGQQWWWFAVCFVFAMIPYLPVVNKVWLRCIDPASAQAKLGRPLPVDPPWSSLRFRVSAKSMPFVAVSAFVGFWVFGLFSAAFNREFSADDKGRVVIRRYGSTVVFKDFDVEDARLRPGFYLVPASDIGSLRLHRLIVEGRGPLEIVREDPIRVDEAEGVGTASEQIVTSSENPIDSRSNRSEATR